MLGNSPEQNAEFVCQMESVLEAYQGRYHPNLPLVCLDESLKQLVKETIKPIAPQTGQPKRYDYTYERNGTANIFMLCNPIEGRRQVKVTQRRTAVDYTHILKDLVDIHYPEALLITIVQDQLNTHSFSSLYKAFPPAEARRILNRKAVLLHPKTWQLVKYC